MPQLNRDSTIRFFLLTGLVMAAALCRLLPASVNFAPIGAIALFGGACFASRRAAFVVPFGAMLLSDVVLNLTRYSEHPSAWEMSTLAYLPFAVIVCLGCLLKNRTRSIGHLIAGSLGASIIFFVVSNFSWFVMHEPFNWATFVKCYVDAIPFFRGTLASDAIFTAALFGMLAFVESRAPQVKRQLTPVVVEHQ